MGLTAAAVATAPLLSGSPVAADQSSPTQPIPRPIPGGIDAPPVGLIHWWLPGPPDAVTPVIGLPGFGLDVDPSTITDFNGYTAYAVVAGESTSSTGATHPTEMDVRVMDGVYLDETGTRREGAYAFL